MLPGDRVEEIDGLLADRGGTGVAALHALILLVPVEVLLASEGAVHNSWIELSSRSQLQVCPSQRERTVNTCDSEEWMTVGRRLSLVRLPDPAVLSEDDVQQPVDVERALPGR